MPDMENLGSTLYSTDFLEKCVKLQADEPQLKYRPVQRKVEYFDLDLRRRVNPEKENGFVLQAGEDVLFRFA
jgi:hypothetical protein